MTNTTSNVLRSGAVALGILGLLLAIGSAMLWADDNVATGGRTGTAPRPATLMVTDLQVTGTALKWHEITIEATIKNIGMASEAPETIELLVNGEVVDRFTYAFQANETVKVTFKRIFVESDVYALEVAAGTSSRQAELYIGEEFECDPSDC